MPIATSCEDCGRDYTVKDELAGKKIKCKDCGAILVVPAARKSGSAPAAPKKRPPPKKAESDDDFLDALDSGKFEDESDEDEELDDLPRRPSSRKPAVKAKKKKSSSGNSAGLWAKIGGGIFTALIVLGFVMRLIRAAGGLGIGGGVSWQEFQAPNGRYTVQMPGVAKSKPQPTPGVTTFLTETRNFACAVTHAPLPAGTGALLSRLPPQTLSDQLLKEAFPAARPITNHPATLGGLPSHEVSFDNAGVRLTERNVIVGDELFNCEFVSRGNPPQAEMTKFFDSFRIVGAGGNAAAPQVSVASSQPAPGGTFQQRRAAFQTKLLKSGPAPQEFQIETPPPGVQVVTFPSGNLQLKAWVAAPNGGNGPKAPALVFFHGGFAFGADDLQACRPAMDAGMVVMAPILRGENGNPGNYELFFGEVDDARAAVKWLAAQPYVDPQKIYTFGHSVGGGVSAMLSLMDDVPIQHGGSSGGLYPDGVFAAWQADGMIPFDLQNPEEKRLRMLIGNMRDMRRKHFAYLGASDTMSLFVNDAKQEAAGSQCQILSVPGDHMTSFDPALREYLKRIASGQ